MYEVQDTVSLQYLQSALAKWRSRNRWADDIEFKNFPPRYRDAIVIAARITQHAGVK